MNNEVNPYSFKFFLVASLICIITFTFTILNKYEHDPLQKTINTIHNYFKNNDYKNSIPINNVSLPILLFFVGLLFCTLLFLFYSATSTNYSSLNFNTIGYVLFYIVMIYMLISFLIGVFDNKLHSEISKETESTIKNPPSWARITLVILFSFLGVYTIFSNSSQTINLQNISSIFNVTPVFPNSDVQTNKFAIKIATMLMMILCIVFLFGVFKKEGIIDILKGEFNNADSSFKQLGTYRYVILFSIIFVCLFIILSVIYLGNFVSSYSAFDVSNTIIIVLLVNVIIGCLIYLKEDTPLIDNVLPSKSRIHNFLIIVLELLGFLAIVASLSKGNIQTNNNSNNINNNFSNTMNNISSLFNDLAKNRKIIILAIVFILVIGIYEFYKHNRNYIVLQSEPESLNNMTVLTNYMTLNSGSDSSNSSYTGVTSTGLIPKYNYGLSCMIYLNANKVNGTKNIISYGKNMQILYDSNKNQLLFVSKIDMDNTTNTSINKINQSLDHTKIIHVVNNVALQKWNKIRVNYDTNIIDIFYNDELVKTETNIVPYIENEDLIIGDKNGSDGEIKEVIYFG